MIIAVRVAVADHGVAVEITAKGIGASGVSAGSEWNVGQSQKNPGFSPGF
jgi:hypothetical protein